MIKIQAGCARHPQLPFWWTYGWQDKAGYHEVAFQAESDERPEIGDFIDGDRLVKRVGYQIDQDHSKWKERFEDTRAYDKMDPPSTW